ncbi:Ditrans polycis-undecaprenyl-diphosphate synthase [termite gut metagenome]|jgi:undecaprenyl diphosphate synthase|uniref:Ditrans polycis-undecaprenyl-diphosphate synthase n=1 Tax=termite gut metagenome TaxID=433724 RepID=A0A5J4S2F3_9ZZZZ
MFLRKEINNTPKHIGIIIDGNGRWARQRGETRSYGHQKGAKQLYSIVELSVQLAIEYLTVYVFSKENWQRPKDEVGSLMNLFEKGLDMDNLLIKNNIRLLIVGDLRGLPTSVGEHLTKCIQRTQTNTGMTLCLALNYSSRLEIVHATKQLAEKVSNKIIRINDISEQLISKYLYTYPMPDIDFLIRTGGEYRLSNFMLWQCSYAELYFCKTLWPDFKEKDYLKAIYEYQKRDRRFGKIK